MKHLTICILLLSAAAFSQPNGPGGTTTGGGVSLIPTKVANLANYASLGRGTVVPISDGTGSTDCTTGGSTTAVLCQYSGSSWAAVAGSGSMVYPSGTGFAIVTSGTSWGTTLTDPLPVAHGGSGGTIANTTFTVSNATFSANTCTKLDSTAGTSTVTMTGVATSSAFWISPAADTATIVGFGTSGGLVINAWPTSNTANIKVCNQTASGITTGATLVFNISAR